MPSLIMFLSLWMAACVMPARAQAPWIPALQQLAPGVYAVIGQDAEPSPENRGVVSNQGILIGDDGVVLIDTGTSARYAASLVQTVRDLTSKPIVLAINTHQNPAFIFGNSALASQGVPVLAHRNVAELIRQRCDQCLSNLKQILGVDEMQGTTVSVPTRLIDDTITITVAGRLLDILYFGHSSSPGSIAVLDRASGVLFAGGLVSIARIPDTTEARIDTWIKALHILKNDGLSVVVPGEGPVAPAVRVDDLRRYLTELQSAVERTYKQGTSLGNAAEHSQLPEFGQWPQYQRRHNKNVEQLYLLLERATLDGL